MEPSPGGDNYFGQADVPGGVFSAVSGGGAHSLGIRSDGTLAGWGSNDYGQTDVPSGTFSAVDAGNYHSLGIRDDGTLVGWGRNNYGQTNVPTGTFSAVSALGDHSLGLRANGTLAGWGWNYYGQTDVPGGVFSAVSAGGYHSLGIRADGTLVGWGRNNYGQTDVPSGVFSAVSAGTIHSLGIRADGSLAGWGDNYFGQADVPGGTYVAVSASYHSLGLEAQTNYSGNLRVYGSGLTANLNRNITVARETVIETLMNVYNNASLTAFGRLTLLSKASVAGGGALFVQKDFQPGIDSAQIKMDTSLVLGTESRTFVELGGRSPGYYDQLVGLRDLSLNGGLEVKLIREFTLSKGDYFDIMTYSGHLKGTFAGLPNGAVVGNYGGYDLRINYRPGVVRLLVVARIPQKAEPR